MWNVGNHSYSWSLATRGTNGIFLYFGTQHLNPNHTYNRGYGLLLRCLSE
ncbi:hypothetical protein [uncultured Rikenella sp.]|nr:hypothetical protein [uncultured Rikenella sp.]